MRVSLVGEGARTQVVALHHGALEGVALDAPYALADAVGDEIACVPCAGCRQHLFASCDLGAQEGGLIEVGEGIDVIACRAQTDAVDLCGQVRGQVVLVHAEKAVRTAGGTVRDKLPVHQQDEGAGGCRRQPDLLPGGQVGQRDIGAKADRAVHCVCRTGLPDRLRHAEAVFMKLHTVFSLIALEVPCTYCDCASGSPVP